MSSMIDQLPPETLADIFLRLPIKLICQLRCVRKSWNSFITDPSFVKSHLNKPNQDHLLLFQGYSKPTEKFSEEVSREEFSILHRDNTAFDKYAELAYPFKEISFCGYFRYIGCCNGIICGTDDQLSIIHHTFLWNPSIKTRVVLPEPRVTFNSHGPYSHAFGFGFDERSNDYKVVRIVHVESSKIPPEVDVYRLSSGTWHNITHLSLPYRIEYKAPQLYLNGASHWLAYDKSKRCHFVVAFLMADEVFRYMKAPKGLKFSKANGIVPLGICQGSLALTSNGWYNSDGLWTVWVMKEYGVAESWTKLFSVSGNPGFDCFVGCEQNGVDFKLNYTQWETCKLKLEHLLGFIETGEALFTVTSGDLISYHPRSGVKKLELNGLKLPYRPLFASSYRESIALVGTKSHELRDHNGLESGGEDQEDGQISEVEGTDKGC